MFSFWAESQCWNVGLQDLTPISVQLPEDERKRRDGNDNDAGYSVPFLGTEIQDARFREN